MGINYLNDQDTKTTMLLGLSALMDIPADAIDGFKLHLLDKLSSLPYLTNNKIENGFLGSAVLAFKFFLMRDKQNRVAQSMVALPGHSPHSFNNEEDYKPLTAMWRVIQVKGNGNIKEACKALAWNMMGSGLQVRWEEHQPAELSAQVLLMNVPPVLDGGGLRAKLSGICPRSRRNC